MTPSSTDRSARPTRKPSASTVPSSKAPSSRDADAIDDGRDETETERLDRNWSQLVQELRVTQTGTQILTGFLLTLAFQQRFAALDRLQVTLYLGLVVLAALTTALGLSPVAIHRALFRRRAMAQLVATGDILLKLTLACVGLILVGTTLFIFAVVGGITAGLTAGAIALVATVILWIVLPFGVRPRREPAGADADVDVDRGDRV